MVIAGGLLLAALPSILDRIADSSNPTNSPDNGAAAPAPLPPTPPEPTPDAEPPTVSPAPTDEPQQPEDTAAQTPEPAPEAEASTTSPVAPPPPTAVAPAPAAAETSTDPPNVETTVPPEGWEPEVSGNASSYGEPDRSDLQWVAWQPNCPSCEPGVTMSWVGSFAYPYNGPIGYTNDFRPKLQSACAHRVRSGPLIDWKVDIGGDQVDALWVDGNEVPAGSWWLLDSDGVGDNPSVMVPEPEPFLALLQDAKELRVLTVEGRDATFAVEGFLTTPVQANLDHCSHYP